MTFIAGQKRTWSLFFILAFLMNPTAMTMMSRGAGIDYGAPAAHNDDMEQPPPHHNEQGDLDRTPSFYALQEGKLAHRTSVARIIKSELTETPLNRIRAPLVAFFEDPTSSPGARAWMYFIMLLIFISIITFIVESAPTLHKEDEGIWFAIETVVVVFFTFEYSIRVFALGRNKQELRKFLVAPLNVIDFLAIFPYYLEVITEAAGGGANIGILRIIRIVRLARIFKLSRHSAKMQLLGDSLKASTEALGVLVFFLGITMILVSSIMYFIERGSWDSERNNYVRDDDTISPYNSIYATFWWTIVTMSTVGYGDVFPVTTIGKIMGGLTIVLALVVLALPISILSGSFSDVYASHKLREKQKEILGSVEEGDEGNTELQYQYLEHLARLRAIKDDLAEWYDRSEVFLAYAPRGSHAQQSAMLSRQGIFSLVDSLDAFMMSIPLRVETCAITPAHTPKGSRQRIAPSSDTTDGVEMSTRPPVPVGRSNQTLLPSTQEEEEGQESEEEITAIEGRDDDV